MVSLKRSAEHGFFKSAVAPTRCACSSIHIVIAVERSQLDLAAAEQSKKQQQHRVLAGETRLRLCAAAELFVDTLEGVGRPHRQPAGSAAADSGTSDTLGSVFS
jgi:hypothetical protein